MPLLPSSSFCPFTVCCKLLLSCCHHCFLSTVVFLLVSSLSLLPCCWYCHALLVFSLHAVVVMRTQWACRGGGQLCARRGLAHPLFTACRVCRANAGGLPWWWGHFGATSNWGEREVDYGGFHGVSGEPKSGANGLGACDDGRRYCVRVDFAQAAWALGTALKAQQRWGARQWVHCACRAFCTAYHTCTRAWEH
eukprot:scaffold43886_cov20-Tisochrysis_lutea.AAC.5